MKRLLAFVCVAALALSAQAATRKQQEKARARPKQRTVTIDVKDADVREILQSFKTQCGIKNLLVDREVGGAATLLLRDVPCDTAFRVVFSMFGLAGQFEPNSVVTVGAAER
ncbi:MAG TPA: hypothetical protein VF824_08540 [Thermoanaerobaculia bacterium]